MEGETRWLMYRPSAGRPRQSNLAGPFFMSTQERNKPVDDQQYENVLGLPRFGGTEDLPGVILLPSTKSFFFGGLASWKPPLRLVPHEIARVNPRPGVYTLWLKPPVTTPGNQSIRTHSTLAYIGESKNLRVRLSGYAKAHNPDRPPVYQVVRDRVVEEYRRTGSHRLAYDYLISHPSEMRATRQRWMGERELQFQVAYTRTHPEARILEEVMIKYCDLHNITLWNSKMNSSRPTWRPPVEEAS